MTQTQNPQPSPTPPASNSTSTSASTSAKLPPLTAALVGALIPQTLRLTRRPQRVLERHWFVSRGGFFWILLGGFFEPFFYLISTQLGFGALVNDVEVAGRLVPYVQFVAPGLLAASAMNGPMFETMNVFFRINFDGVYNAMLATPLSAGDVVVGDTFWATLRGGIYSALFVVAMVIMGMTSSWWGLLLLPVSLLISFAFAGVGMAIATFIRSVEDFEYVPTVMLPMFLFSATFFPASSYGRFEWLLNLSPLYHGVALLRAVNLGEFSWSLLVNVGVLLALAVFSTGLAARRIERTILS